MKNRAKCRICEDILESFHRWDYVTCKCGEISIDGGNDHFGCAAKDFKNFIRIDDDGNEIVPKVIENDISSGNEKTQTPLTKEERMKLLDEMISNIEKLPQNAMTQPITHYDFISLLFVLRAILRSD